MEAAVDAARWVVRKALAPVADGLLESWAASAGLGHNIDALKMELLYAQGMLDSAQGRDIRSAALKELLQKLRQLAYGADDVLDELEYFRIKDALDGTYHASDMHAQGYVHGLALNVRHTARAAMNKLKPASRSRDASHGDPGDQGDGGKQGCISIFRSCNTHQIRSSPASPTNQGVQEVGSGCMPKVTSCARSTAHTIGKQFPCYSFPYVHDDNAHTVMSESSDVIRSGQGFLGVAWPCKARRRNHTAQTTKVEFGRVEMSEKMMEIVEQLKPLCAKVSTILNLELSGTSRMTTQDIALSRPKTTSGIIEPKIYGRDTEKKNILAEITHGKYCVDEITVLPIVGPGGIGKTTLVQHIYQEAKSLFQVWVWVCVSLDFNANKLIQEIVKKIPKVIGEKENASDEELITQRLKSKRLLLVLDDMWRYDEDEWKKLLAPLRHNGVEKGKGNMVIVTTRIPVVARMVSTTNSSIELERLGHADIFSFFEVCVFGDQQPWKDHLELRDIGEKIVSKLKGFPLAAKTVGRLLRNKLALDHWTKVVESREWELQTSENDIMPALKLSYDYLPFHLQQCFSYCALFPEDYEFGSKELVQLWIGLDILHSSDQNKRIKDVGLSYLDDLVSHGFFKESKTEDGPCYVIHDLLHELAVKVSSYECISINSSNVRSMQITPSIRHLSIIVDNNDVKDVMSFKGFKNDLSALGTKSKVVNVRTLMLFGEYHGSFVTTFRGLLKEARALRTIFLSCATYSLDDLFLNFSEFFHLRYLRIKSVCNDDTHLPSALFRSYHLEVIDLEKWGGRFCSTRDISNLLKLRYFLVPRYKLELQSDIFEVGKLKFLEELRRFEVRKEKGFELSQLGELTELGGSLGIYNLEKVQTKEEGKELKLIHKNYLQELILEWDNKNTTHEENVFESLVPHKNLQDLCIRGHGGANCPSWLGGSLSVSNLVSLCLYDVSWSKFPPLGDMWFIDHGEECQGSVSGQGFQNLKRLKLVKIKKLKKWVGNEPCHLFSLLEVVIIEDCPELIELPFSHPTCYQAKQVENMTWFPNLRELEIIDCPKLSSLPPLPWTPAPCSIQIAQVGTGSGFLELVYSKIDKSELYISIKGKGDQDSMFWSRLCFNNLVDVDGFIMENCPPLPLIHLQKLKSLKTLRTISMSDVLSFEGESHNVGCPLPVERIQFVRCGANCKELTHVLSHFPKLEQLYIKSCQNITGLGVVEHQTTTTTSASSPSSSGLVLTGHQQQRTRAEEELAADGGVLLLPPQLQFLIIKNCQELRLLSSLPPQLRRLIIKNCQELRLLSSSLDNSNTAVTGVFINGCPNSLSFCSSSPSSCFPFPASLQSLSVSHTRVETLAPLSNLIFLIELHMFDCGDVTGDCLWPLVAQGHLTKLSIYRSPKFFTGADPSWLSDEDRRSGSSKIGHLRTDDLAEVLIPPICRLLSSSLTKLSFSMIKEVERFTVEQEESLHLLTSLEDLEFRWCDKLRHLPAGLTKLTNLKRLQINSCPAIRSLPKDGLPRCLQELDVSGGRGGENSKELIRKCRKLIGTIPIVRTYTTNYH